MSDMYVQFRPILSRWVGFQSTHSLVPLAGHCGKQQARQAQPGKQPGRPARVRAGASEFRTGVAAGSAGSE